MQMQILCTYPRSIHNLPFLWAQSLSTIASFQVNKYPRIIFDYCNFSYLIQIHFISVSDLIDRSDPFTQLKSNSIEDQNGYKFSFDRLLKNGDKTWRCAKRRSKCKCQAYVKTRENLIILQYYKHNHHPYGANSSIGGFFWINIVRIFTHVVGLFLVRWGYPCRLVVLT